MRKILLFTILIISVAHNLTAQKQFPPKLLWSRCYGTSSKEYSWDQIFTNDSCVQITGSNNYLIKVNKNGNLLWEKTQSGGVPSPYSAQATMQSKDDTLYLSFGVLVAVVLVCNL